MFAGEGDMSKIKIPCNNGPYRDGKGSLYEGGTPVVSLADWPGHIQPGTVNEMIHAVDMYSTLASLAGASIAKCKSLDGMDVRGTISEGKPSPSRAKPLARLSHSITHLQRVPHNGC
jgi:arylsulfatase A-like enzyme